MGMPIVKAMLALACLDALTYADEFVPTITAAKVVTPSEAVPGHFVDPRDKHRYGTVKIGDQTWMAENLAMWTMGSWCYEGQERNCQTYGRLYSWQSSRMACPDGWHLPTVADWDLLRTATGILETGTRLKARKGWNGADAYGFHALPGGARNGDGTYDVKDSCATWWSATTDSPEGTYVYGLITENPSMVTMPVSNRMAFSVRCVKNGR